MVNDNFEGDYGRVEGLNRKGLREEVRVNLMMFYSLEHVLPPRTQNVN